MSENFDSQPAQVLEFRAAGNEALNNAENTSGRGEDAKVPESIASKFNWGAFLLNWIWGLGNKTYITLIIFAVCLISIIPIVGWLAVLGCQIWFGIKGNEWAWRNKKWINEEHFNSVQKNWAIAGTVLTIVSILISLVYFAVIFSAFMSGMSEVGSY